MEDPAGGPAVAGEVQLRTLQVRRCQGATQGPGLPARQPNAARNKMLKLAPSRRAGRQSTACRRLVSSVVHHRDEGNMTAPAG